MDATTRDLAYQLWMAISFLDFMLVCCAFLSLARGHWVVALTCFAAIFKH